MIKKTITYTDYNGNEIKEDFFFHFSEAELTELQFSFANGYSEAAQKIIDTKDNVKLMAMFKELLLKAYGVKSDDGKRFIKSKELSTAFSQTEAYSTLYMELLSDDNVAAEFFKGVIPAKMLKAVEKAEKAKKTKAKAKTTE